MCFSHAGIPLVFASGHGDWALPEEQRDKPRLMKPFTAAALEEHIKSLCGEAQLRRERATNFRIGLAAGKGGFAATPMVVS